MKKQLVVMLTVLTVLSSLPSLGRADDGCYGFLFGYRGYTFEEQTFTHNTHPDDAFLPNSGTPGSAGTTKLGGGLTSFIALGIQYEKPVIIENLMLSINLGGLFGGERDQQQNSNDSRPVANGAFIYSEREFGAFGGLGLSYFLGQFYFGGEVSLVGVYESHGWNRYGEDEAVESGMEWYPSFGPKIGYRFTNEIGFEAGVQFGEVPNASLSILVFL
jgi:hypothetical protein